jgi:hypothetical protein
MSYEGWEPDPDPDPDPTRRDASTDERRGGIPRDRWWALNGMLRFYGFVFLLGTKTADAATTAVGLHYVPGIVELNPFADAVFADGGTIAGLAVLSVATVALATLAAEFVAVEVHRRLGRDRLALSLKALVYGSLSALFGAIAVQNALLISDMVQAHLSEILVAVV